MPLGSFRLNGLSRKGGFVYLGPRSNNAIVTSSSETFNYAGTGKFGGNAITTTSTTSRYYVIQVYPKTSSWYLNTNNSWTVEFWVNVFSKGTEGIRSIFALRQFLGQSSLNISDTVSNGTWQLNFNNSTSYLSDAFPSPGSTNQNQWYHIAIVSNGTGNIKYFVDGTQTYSGSLSITGTDATSNRSISLGHSGSSNSTVYFDEIRISDTARYTAGFTPPSAAFTEDNNTMALVHFDGTSTDDSTLPALTSSLFFAEQSSPYISIYNRNVDTFNKLSNPVISPTTNSQSHIAVNPAGTSFVITHGTSPYISIYNRSGDIFTRLSNPSSLPPAECHGVAWNHDGTSFAVVHDSSPYISIYNRSGDTFTKLSNPSTLPSGSGEGVAWNHDGTSVAIGTGGATPELRIYNRSGNTFSSVAVLTPGGGCYSVAWNHDGTSIAVGHTSSPYVSIYNRSGNTFTKLSNPGTLPGSTVNGLAWNHDGTSLAVGCGVSPYVLIYNRSGDTFTKISNPATLPTSNLQDVAWNSNGTSLAIMQSSSPYISIYNRSGDTFTKLSDPQALPTSYARALTWAVKP